MKKMLIASTSTLHGGTYLDYILPEIKKLFAGCKDIVFVPYATPCGLSHDDYTMRASAAFEKIGLNVMGIHQFNDPAEAVRNAEGMFVGGGNTFVLVKQLYDNGLMNLISDRVNGGMPYFGSSAGSNITGVSMKTTNDMPIVYPPDFSTLNLIPFNLNPHYLDADLQSKHMGETRETRIREFHHFNSTPVLGLREGSWLDVAGDTIMLRGGLKARLFRKDLDPEEIANGTNLSFIR